MIAARPGMLQLAPGAIATLFLVGSWLGAQSGEIVLTLRADGPAALLGLPDLGPLELLVLGAAATGLWRGADSCRADVAGWPAWACALLQALPSALAGTVALGAYALFVAARSTGAARWGAIGMAGLALDMLWHKHGMPLVGGVLIDAEASATSALLGLAEPALTRSGEVLRMPDGHASAILPGCSAGQILPVALLALFVLLRTEVDCASWRRVAAAGAVLTIAILAANLGRLAMLGWSPMAYAWGHGVIGANVFGLVNVALLQVIAARAAAHA